MNLVAYERRPEDPMEIYYFMKATFEPRSRIEDRVNLAGVIPLSSPLTMLVEVASVCNLRCHFLPDRRYKVDENTGS